jgi:hypothetical protein
MKMDGKTVTLIGAAAALAGVPALAAPPAAEPAVAASYAELLEPIPNAVERLKVADAQEAARPPQLIEAQYADQHHHHHNNQHHHHHHNRRWYQQHGYYWFGGQWTLRPPHHHHHHHHHNNNY